jgi:3-oxoadipate enol-lactonase
MGGMVGLWLGVNAAECLGGLVLANTAPRIGTSETWNARIETVRRGGMQAVSALVIARWFTPEFRRSSPHRVTWAQAMLESSPPEGYARCCAAIRDMDQRGAAGRISLPTLVIAGAKDAVTPPADGRSLAAEISAAQYIELEAAHLSNVEQEERFTETLAAFVEQQEKTHG